MPFCSQALILKPPLFLRPHTYQGEDIHRKPLTTHKKRPNFDYGRISFSKWGVGAYDIKVTYLSTPINCGYKNYPTNENVHQYCLFVNSHSRLISQKSSQSR